jgi:hypothetical protein
MGRHTAGLLLAILLVWSLWTAAPARAQDDVSWLLGQVNGLRAGLGLHAYALNGQLSAAAAAHSQYMATTCHYSHTENNGSTPASRAAAQGYGGSRVSENIYGGPRAQASNAWSFWINSGVHYAGLTHATANEVGIGVAQGPCGQAYTMLFGHGGGGAAPAPAPAAPGGEAAAVAAVPPSPRPYVPPPPTRTPTATIDTLTPSATWTITPTRTPTLTGTAAPPTSTPLVLPTVPALGQRSPTPILIALQPSATSTPTEAPSATPTPPPTPAPQRVEQSAGGFDARDLVPLALLGPALVIGVAGFAYFRRVK